MRRTITSALLALLAVGCGRSGVLRYTPFTDGGALDGGEDAGFDAGLVPCTPGHPLLERAVPTVLFVLDRSASMNDRFSGTTRWRALTDALATALPPVDQSIAMGALTYPMQGRGLTCAASVSPDLAPAFGNASAIVSLMRSTNPSGSTPTAQAVDAAGLSLLALQGAHRARGLVLATDGAPDCNAALDGNTCVCLSGGRNGRACNADRCLDDTRTVGRIAALLAQGVPTWVIGIQTASDSVFVKVLDAMAVAGGRAQTDAGTQYFAVSSQAELSSALDAIRDQVSACVFFSSSVPEDDADLALWLGDELVPPGDGWTFTDRAQGEITLWGAWCEKAAANPALTLDATVACHDP